MLWLNTSLPTASQQLVQGLLQPPWWGKLPGQQAAPAQQFPVLWGAQCAGPWLRGGHGLCKAELSKAALSTLQPLRGRALLPRCPQAPGCASLGWDVARHPSRSRTFPLGTALPQRRLFGGDLLSAGLGSLPGRAGTRRQWELFQAGPGAFLLVQQSQGPGRKDSGQMNGAAGGAGSSCHSSQGIPCKSKASGQPQAASTTLPACPLLTVSGLSESVMRPLSTSLRISRD